jgi:hypothetical protein
MRIVAANGMQVNCIRWHMWLVLRATQSHLPLGRVSRGSGLLFQASPDPFAEFSNSGSFGRGFESCKDMSFNGAGRMFQERKTDVSPY